MNNIQIIFAVLTLVLMFLASVTTKNVKGLRHTVGSIFYSLGCTSLFLTLLLGL
jgi:protein-S-isoprenylcysteine O-methyltransferase Ste14